MSNNSTGNDTDQCPPFLTWYEDPYNLTMFVLYVLVIGAALIGNILVCLTAIINSSLRQNIASYFIVSLAVSDLLTASLSMPFDLETFMTYGRWYHSEMLCVVSSTAYLITVPTSMWNLFVLSVNRYKTLKNPWDRFKESPFMTRRRALTAIFMVWIVSIGPVIGAQIERKFNEGGSLIYHHCFGMQCIYNVSKYFLIISSVFNFYVPMFFMCIIYYKIYQIARTQYLSRPTSAVLELKSGDCPAMKPKRGCQRNTQSLHTEIHPAKLELGHANKALNINDGKKMIRSGTMVEELDEIEKQNENSGELSQTIDVDKTKDVDANKGSGYRTSIPEPDKGLQRAQETENITEFHENSEKLSTVVENQGSEGEQHAEENTDQWGGHINNEESLNNNKNTKCPRQEKDSNVKCQETSLPPQVRTEEKEDSEKEQINQASSSPLNQEMDSRNDEAEGEKTNVPQASTSLHDNIMTPSTTNEGVESSTQEIPNDLPSPTTCISNGQSSLDENKTDCKSNRFTNKAGISHEMHDYLRRRLSTGEYKVKYASRESIESTCTIHSNLPYFRNSTLTLNMPASSASRERSESFGSMENLTKRRKIFVKNKKAARTISIIVGTFLICWMPLTTRSIVFNICGKKCYEGMTYEDKIINLQIFHVLMLFGYLSSAINPIVYTCRNVHFRKSYRKVIRQFCCRN